MGRPGRGGGGRAGGGRSSFRSGGGRRIGSSRAGRGSRPSFRSRPPRPPRGGRPPRRRYYGGGYVARPARGGCALSTALIVLIIGFIIIAAIFAFVRGGFGSGDVSTIERTKLADPAPYVNDCIVDELGWFDNESRAESRLRDFYDETGVQPYVVLKDYDPSLTSDEQKEAWAQDYYEANIDNENTLLYVYFAEEYTDDEVGYAAYVLGRQATSVMDSEAMDVFWGQLDRYWYSDLSTDDVFVSAFNETASIIMKTYTSGWDVAKIALIVIAVALVIFGIVKILRVRRQHEAEEAAETERILKASMDDLVNEAAGASDDKPADGGNSGADGSGGAADV